MSLHLRPWPNDIITLQQLSNRGQILANNRYMYAKVAVENQEYFYKKAQSEEVGTFFDHELIWADFMNGLSSHYPNLNIRGLSIFSYLPHQAILTEFIDAPFLTSSDDTAQLAAYLDRYVDVLKAIDSFGRTWHSNNLPKDVSTPYDQLEKGWDKWINGAKLIEKAIITDQQIKEAQQIIERNKPYITPCMQHGDFVPWHIFNQNGTWIIYDAEHASHLFPRFYDLAYTYTRLYTRGQNTAFADSLLSKFIDHVDISEQDFFRQFVPVVLSRAVGMLFDAENDLKDIDYRREAQELFRHWLELGRRQNHTGS